MMRRHRSIMLCCAVMLTAGSHSAQVRSVALADLQTRAERTNYRETSSYADVMAFLTTVDQASPLVHLTSMGYTFEGRSLPLAIVGKLPAFTPEAVRASGKLRVYLQANVHSGEVEGKEAVQMLARDIALGKYAAWMDSMVLLIGPNYNADGNEKVNLTNRGAQHGPVGGTGTRANAQGLNINRDYMKLETPEARSMVRLLNEFDPHIMFDLHTTNGSRHAYFLTFETPNNPAVDPAIADLCRNEWMPSVIQTVRRKYDWDFRFYGNVSGREPERSWTTVEDLPRYSHNYWGLRNRFGILSEAYSYATFEDRRIATTRFIEETLDFAHSNAARIRKIADDADARNLIGQRLSMRSEARRSNAMVEILMGETVDDFNPYTGRAMQRRSNVRRPEKMWEYATFASTDSERVPTAYFVPPALKGVIERLQAHGVRMERVTQPATAPIEEFQIDSSEVTSQAFENHQERTVTGKYAPAEKALPAGTMRVPMNQPLARLAFYLLEPRSNDSLLTWNFLDDAIKDSRVYPIVRTRN